MAQIFVPRNLPRLPTVAQARTSTPVRAHTAGAVVDYANHLAGYRLLRSIGQFIEGAVDTSTHYAPQNAGEASLRFFSGLTATHLWVSFSYNAVDAGVSGSEPMVTATLEKPDGTVIDAGCRFRRTNGTLPGFREDDGRLGAGWIGVDHTYTPNRPSLADGGSLTGPRPLVLPAPGDDVCLRLVWQHCRVYSVTAIELYREVIE